MTKKSTTSISIGGWNNRADASRRSLSDDTSGGSDNVSVMVRGRFVDTGREGREVHLSVVPSSIEKKQAVRRSNARLAGVTASSATFTKAKP